LNGLTLLALIVVLAGGFVAYRAGFMRGRSEGRNAARPTSGTAASPYGTPAEAPASAAEALLARSPAPDALAAPPASAAHPETAALADESARLVRVLAMESFALRADAVSATAMSTHFADLAEDRRRLLRQLADARGDVARYRQLVIDLENDAPPPLLTGPHALDDLKLVVGIGPMLERMLQQLGVTTYRQIARWSERDIDEFDAKLPEFPGRIRRDEWVKQARELHQSKYGERLDLRG
jgi:predicted flap endonuclease-1-like 5' DNA nuclease